MGLLDGDELDLEDERSSARTSRRRRLRPGPGGRATAAGHVEGCGARVGPYVVVEPIGAGGMGEVYRARDTRLGRDVALKTLSGSFARDPERLARFEREARLLAALNHPHVGAIYGIEDALGTPALVLELV